MSASEVQSGNIDVEKIVLSIRAEVVHDLLQRRRVADVIHIIQNIPLPDLSDHSPLCKFISTVPPFKQITRLLLRVGKVLFLHYTHNTRVAMRLLLEELDRQDYIIKYLLQTTEKKN